MSNPYLSSSPVFSPARPAEQGFYAPAPTTIDTADARPDASARPMTYDDVILRTSTLLGVLVAAGAVGWFLTADQPVIWIGALVVASVLGIVNAVRKTPSVPLIVAYAAAEGLFLGSLSAAYNALAGGIVLQAVLATVATLAATLLLYRSGAVRVTPKFRRFLLIAMVGYAIFSLLNLILVWTNAASGWGLRAGGWGILIGLFAVGLAAASLISDYDAIDNGVRKRVPAAFAWSAAFGLTVTLVWLYLEFLRLLAILREN